MKKLDRRQALKSAGAAAAVLASGGFARAQGTANTLKMGVIVGQTGGYAVYAAELRRGVELAVEIVNAKGLQIGGKPYKIETTYYDDRTEAATAARLVERAVTNDGCHAVLASGGSPIVKANVSVAQRLRFPMMPLWSQVDGVYAAQKGAPYMFSAIPPFSLMYRQIMNLIGTLDNPKIKRIAMVTPNDELGVYTGKEYLPEDAKLNKLDLIDVEYYPPGSQEYTTALSRLRRNNPDALIINALFNDIVGVLKEMRSTDWFPKVVVVETSGGLREAFGDVLNGIFVPLLWDKAVSATRDTYIGTGPDFAKLYAKKYGKEMPDFVAAVGAHNVMTYCQVLMKAGVIDDPRKIRAAFQAFDGETFFGKVGFREDGLNVKGAILAGQFQNQVPQIVYPKEARLAEPIHPYPGSKG